jgi:FkbM family methyltransferase
MKHSSEIAICTFVLLTTFNIFLSFRPNYQFRYLKGSNLNGVASCGYGGGIGIINNNEKQFVTMIQKRMFKLNDHGYIPMPNITKRVWIDVGSNSDSFLGSCGPCRRSYWPNRSRLTLKEEFQQSNDLFVIAIEPNIDFYEYLSKIPRLIPIMAAIFTVEGTRAFYEYAATGCSSLLEPNPNIDKKLSKYDWFDVCTKIKKTTGVSTLRLETILSIIDPSLNIELLKVDAQGVDLDVVKSGGKQLRRIGKIIIETQIDNSKKNESNILYKNGNTAVETLEYMQAEGFAFDEKQSSIENKAIEEHNYVFNNRIK